MKPKIILLAANMRHAKHWMYEHRVHERNVIYIGEPDSLRGLQLENYVIIYAPTYYEHQMAEEIEALIGHMMSRINTPKGGTD